MKGRFAPSPSGRMHLGNVYSAFFSYLHAKKSGGQWILRIEDLDRQRCKKVYSDLLLEDLLWLGLRWDNYSFQNGGLLPEFYQSQRNSFYQKAFDSLCEQNLVYDCFCSRADLQASSAPHQNEGGRIYSGKCRNLSDSEKKCLMEKRKPSKRIKIENLEIEFYDGNYGLKKYNLAESFGDFVIRRADGNFSYQLAVVVDDALMEVDDVVRGRDLLSSAAAQIFLYGKLHYQPPAFFHLPLLLSAGGRRLSKREKDTDMTSLRSLFSPEQIFGKLMAITGFIEKEEKISLSEAVDIFVPEKMRKEDICLQV
ncbi:MAG: tRNA glutamyl-Q(34) synthetase GluQRS [Treponema sp.]|nr:tRNA glutamyl-Q(34) synthetase GluQRS [Treponema sp.]